MKNSAFSGGHQKCHECQQHSQPQVSLEGSSGHCLSCLWPSGVMKTGSLTLKSHFGYWLVAFVSLHSWDAAPCWCCLSLWRRLMNFHSPTLIFNLRGQFTACNPQVGAVSKQRAIFLNGGAQDRDTWFTSSLCTMIYFISGCPFRGAKPAQRGSTANVGTTVILISAFCLCWSLNYPTAHHRQA